MQVADSSSTTDERDLLDAPIGWIDPARYAEMTDKAMAYRRQLLAVGIKPDLETYRHG